MSSRRRKRQADAKPVRAESAAGILQKETPPSTSEVQAQPRALRTLLFLGNSVVKNVLSLDKTFKNVWFYVPVLFFVYNLQPQLGVTVFSQSDNPSAALFGVTNTGTLSAYGVEISCKFNNRVMAKDDSIIRHRGPPVEGNPPTDILPHGQTATRDCATVKVHQGDIGLQDLRIDLIINYHWLWGILPSSLTFHFDTRREGNRFILVPDVETTFPTSSTAGQAPTVNA